MCFYAGTVIFVLRKFSLKCGCAHRHIHILIHIHTHTHTHRHTHTPQSKKANKFFQYKAVFKEQKHHVGFTNHAWVIFEKKIGLFKVKNYNQYISKSNYITLKPFICLWEEPTISLVYFSNCSIVWSIRYHHQIWFFIRLESIWSYLAKIVLLLFW